MKLAPRISRPSVPKMDKPQRFRSKEHLEWIRGLGYCAATGRTMKVDPHHLMHWIEADGSRKLRGQRKWGDDLVIPIGRDVHDAATKSGRPEEYLRQRYGIVHRDLAKALMSVTGDDRAAYRLLDKHLAESRLRLKSDAVPRQSPTPMTPEQ